MPMSAEEFIREKQKKILEERELRREAQWRAQEALAKHQRILAKERAERTKQRKQEYREANEIISCISPRNLHLRQLLEFRPDRYKAKRVTISEYIIAAVLEKLERDGIDIHMFDDE